MSRLGLGKIWYLVFGRPQGIVDGFGRDTHHERDSVISLVQRFLVASV